LLFCKMWYYTTKDIVLSGCFFELKSAFKRVRCEQPNNIIQVSVWLFFKNNPLLNLLHELYHPP